MQSAQDMADSNLNHGLLRAWNSVDLVPVNPKAAISSLHQVRIPIPR